MRLYSECGFMQRLHNAVLRINKYTHKLIRFRMAKFVVTSSTKELSILCVMIFHVIIDMLILLVV